MPFLVAVFNSFHKILFLVLLHLPHVFGLFAAAFLGENVCFGVEVALRVMFNSYVFLSRRSYVSEVNVVAVLNHA